MTDLSKHISRLQFITNDNCPFTHIEQTEMACRGGIKWIQLRMKGATESIWMETALQVRAITKKHQVILIINDNPRIAQTIKADGVHLGKNDLSPKEVREILGPDYIIGSTVNQLDDLFDLPIQAINYIGVGPFRFTSTKKELSPVLGLQGIQEITDHLSKSDINMPAIAIGGIRLEDIAALSKTNVYGLAISSAISSSYNILETAITWANSVEKNFKN